MRRATTSTPHGARKTDTMDCELVHHTLVVVDCSAAVEYVKTDDKLMQGNSDVDLGRVKKADRCLISL